MRRRSKPTIRARLRHRDAANGQGGAEFVEMDAAELTGVFAAPQWLRDLGLMSWLLAGVALLVLALVSLLALTQTIVAPVLTAAILASVSTPLVAALQRRRLPRAAGAAVVLLLIVAIGALVGWVILRGITSEAGHLTADAQRGADKIAGWAKDLGVNSSSAEKAKDSASGSASGAFHTLITGLGKGLEQLAGLAIFLSFTALSLFFLLKDGPMIRAWGERHMGVPLPVASVISRRTIGSLRGYFGGVTAVAAFNGIVIGLGAVVVGLPLAGSIAVVNFVGAYIPYLGAWTAGAFTVLIALGAEGPEAALAMGVIALLANGVLQQLVQPFAFGAALGIHPLAVLIVTIAGGAIFGMIGLVLAAPVTSAVTKISADIARARETKAPAPAPAPPPAVPQAS